MRSEHAKILIHHYKVKAAQAEAQGMIDEREAMLKEVDSLIEQQAPFVFKDPWKARFEVIQAQRDALNEFRKQFA